MAHSSPAVGAEGKNGFPGEIMGSQKGGDRRSHRIEPVGRAEQNGTVRCDVALFRQSRLIPFAGFLFGLGLAGIVIVRVCLSRFDFKQRPVCSFLNVLCQLAGVPLIGKVRNQCFIHNTILQMMVLFC